jgi:hypothetical protein
MAALAHDCTTFFRFVRANRLVAKPSPHQRVNLKRSAALGVEVDQHAAAAVHLSAACNVKTAVGGKVAWFKDSEGNTLAIIQNSRAARATGEGCKCRRHEFNR